MSFEDRLSQKFSSAERGMPHSFVDWNATISRAKRDRATRMLLVVAAAVLLVGGAAWSASEVLDSDPAPLPAPANTSEDPAPEPNPTAEATPAEMDGEGSDARLVRTRVLDWAKALSLGDEEAAWSLMSPVAHEYFGSVEEFRRNELPAFAEGWGSWYTSDPPPETDARALVSSGDGVLGVVTVYGQVTKEGNDEYDADAVAFRIIDGEVFIEPYSSKIEITPLEPSFNQSYEYDAPAFQFRAEIPSDVLQVNFLVAGDGRAVNDASVEEQERTDSQPPNSIASYQYTAGLDPGPHFVTIAAVDANGEVSVLVVPFFTE